MRTVEEFTKIVEEENQKHNEKLLNMSPATLIDRAWEIAKWQAIYDFELDYDEPQWTNWDNLDDIVLEMFRAIKNQNN